MKTAVFYNNTFLFLAFLSAMINNTSKGKQDRQIKGLLLVFLRLVFVKNYPDSYRDPSFHF
ncbi:MAG: hypothetical protein AAGJ93_11680, partial [Bacteroidota bacterium]